MAWADAVGLRSHTKWADLITHRTGGGMPRSPSIYTLQKRGKSSNMITMSRDKQLKAKPGCILGGSKHWVSIICLVASLGVSINRPSEMGYCLGFDDYEVAVGIPWKNVRIEQAEPEKGNCPTCIGVVDDTLGSCGAVTNCVSSFDDRFAFFIAPWEFPGNLSSAVDALRKTLLSEGATLKEQEERYVHALFTSKDGTVDDLEFLFSSPPVDAIVNLRAASRAKDITDYGRNRKRFEELRRALGWEEVPILRNRQRKLFFLESPWDSFGPDPPPVFDFKGGIEIPE